MTRTPQKIAVLYSRGPHLIKLLHFLRKSYPDAIIGLYLPEGYPERNIAGLADRLVRVPQAKFRDFWGRLGLLRQLRGMKPDMLVIMFPSVKLRLFAALSGVGSSHCYSVNGEFNAVKVGLFREIVRYFHSRIRGYTEYLRIKAHISHHRVGK